MAVGAFQFYLQYAYGQLRLHIWYSVISTAISMPIVIYAALVHGAYGAALAWFFLRLATFLIWPPVVHRRFAPRLNGVWMGEMLRITAMTVLGLLIGAPLVRGNRQRQPLRHPAGAGHERGGLPAAGGRQLEVTGQQALSTHHQASIQKWN